MIKIFDTADLDLADRADAEAINHAAERVRTAPYGSITARRRRLQFEILAQLARSMAKPARVVIVALLLLDIGLFITGCTSRDQMRGPTEAQRSYESIRGMIDTIRGPEL